MPKVALTRLFLPLCVAVVFSRAAAAQAQPPKPVPPPAYPPQPAQPPVEKLGPGLFRVGQIRVDTARREISVPGSVNQVTVLEFLANTKGGMKVYESALTLETDAITFNLALVLLGLDKSHSQPPTRHFDTATPTGDPVELWVEWGDGGLKQRVPAERLLFDKNAAQAVTESKWVYTGSTFVSGGRYLAEMDGVLVGFVHSPAPVIENARGVGVSQYGTIVLNPNLGLTPGMPIVFIVKAL